MTEPLSTVHRLRKGWKPQKNRLQLLHNEHPTNIRFHRACSWLQRVEDAEKLGDSDVDFSLIGHWIAFNALYGQWNESEQEPARDLLSWKRFIERIHQLDQNGTLANTLTEHKPLVMTIFEDEYLSRFYWEEPGEMRARKSQKIKFDARNWYLEGRWLLIVERVLERIYLLRCQLVHGAATHNSQLNRTACRRCTLMLNHLLTAILQIWIDHGADEDWGTLCYPPQRKSAASNGSVGGQFRNGPPATARRS